MTQESLEGLLFIQLSLMDLGSVTIDLLIFLILLHPLKVISKACLKMSACPMSRMLKENKVLANVCQNINGRGLPPGGIFVKSLVTSQIPKSVPGSPQFLMIFHGSSGKRTLETTVYYIIYTNILFNVIYMISLSWQFTILKKFFLLMFIYF